MGKDNLRIIDWLLSSGRSAALETHSAFGAFWQAFSKESGSWNSPVDRAIAGGSVADCMAYAFAAGYCAALQRLFPALPVNMPASFCITEEKGAHPRAIETRLTPVEIDPKRGKAFTVNGRKKYVSCAGEAGLLLVAASEGRTVDGRNRVRVVQIDAKTPGIRIVPVKGLNLVPEISHGELIFTDVAVFEADLLPGDGYTAYIKPFRTVEDLHVSAAILGYLFKSACKYDWGREVLENILGCTVSVRSLACCSPDSPKVHIVTHEALKRIRDLSVRLDPFWEKAGRKAKEAWDRDKALMDIADKARALRLRAAWKFYEERGKKD